MVVLVAWGRGSLLRYTKPSSAGSQQRGRPQLENAMRLSLCFGIPKQARRAHRVWVVKVDGTFGLSRARRGAAEALDPSAERRRQRVLEDAAFVVERPANAGALDRVGRDERVRAKVDAAGAVDVESAAALPRRVGAHVRPAHVRLAVGDVHRRAAISRVVREEALLALELKGESGERKGDGDEGSRRRRRFQRVEVGEHRPRRATGLPDNHAPVPDRLICALVQEGAY
eukprot:2253390-Pleurochrysis_carterae.AAC.2